MKFIRLRKLLKHPGFRVSLAGDSRAKVVGSCHPRWCGLSGDSPVFESSVLLWVSPKPYSQSNHNQLNGSLSQTWMESCLWAVIDSPIWAEEMCSHISLGKSHNKPKWVRSEQRTSLLCPNTGPVFAAPAVWFSLFSFSDTLPSESASFPPHSPIRLTRLSWLKGPTSFFQRLLPGLLTLFPFCCWKPARDCEARSELVAVVF